MEFENLQIEVPTGENASQYLGVKVYEKKYPNRAKGFVVGFDPNSKEYIERKQRRAKRFGFKDNRIRCPSDDNNSLTDVEKFKKIDLKALQWPPVPDDPDEIRHDAILVYGVEDMSTSDVFEYFKLFGPETIEWIDDYSCNVVWDDKSSVLNALDSLSKTFGKLLEIQRIAAAQDNTSNTRPITPIVPVIIKEEDDDYDSAGDENIVHIQEEDAIDPKDVWRVGLSFNECQLFLRYATIKDRKLPGAAKRSEYYLKYGKTENTSVAGVLSNSRKRKLQQMQKLAVERFKTKEPDVKIVDLAELKAEGIINKMEVDDEEEPIVKRINIHTFNDDKNPYDNDNERITMTMVADKVEVQQRLGDRYAADTVHDRLGTPLPENIENERMRGIHNRLGLTALDRLGRRNHDEKADARNEIQNTRRTHHNNQSYHSKGSYIDEYGDYHDVYRADELKKEVIEDTKPNITRYDESDNEQYETNHRNHNSNNESSNRNHSNVRDRLGTSRVENRLRSSRDNHRIGSTREEVASPVSDLRDKLRRRELSQHQAPLEEEEEEAPLDEEDIKDENDGDKLNLCIEIKQEPRDHVVDESRDHVRDEPRDHNRDEPRDHNRDEPRDHNRDEPRDHVRDKPRDHDGDIHMEDMDDFEF